MNGPTLSQLASIEALAEQQLEREVAEALRVSEMNSSERYIWLEENWGRLQDGASSYYAEFSRELPGARCYESFAEKNKADDERELQRALRIQAAFFT